MRSCLPDLGAAHDGSATGAEDGGGRQRFFHADCTAACGALDRSISSRGAVMNHILG